MMNTGTWCMELNRFNPSESSLGRAKPGAGSGLQEPFHNGPPPCHRGSSQWECSILQNRRQIKPQTKTVINYTVEKARLYWGGQHFQQGAQKLELLKTGAEAAPRPSAECETTVPGFLSQAANHRRLARTRVLANGYQNIYIQTFHGGENNATGSSSGRAGQQRAVFLVRRRPPARLLPGTETAAAMIWYFREHFSECHIYKDQSI